MHRRCGGAAGDAPGGGAAGDAPDSGAAGDAPDSGAAGDAPEGGAAGDAPDGAAGVGPEGGAAGVAGGVGVGAKGDDKVGEGLGDPAGAGWTGVGLTAGIVAMGTGVMVAGGAGATGAGFGTGPGARTWADAGLPAARAQATISAAVASPRRRRADATTASGGTYCAAIKRNPTEDAPSKRSDAPKTASVIARTGELSAAASSARDHIDERERAASGTIHNAYHGYAFGRANHAANASAVVRSTGGMRRAASASAPSIPATRATAGPRPVAAARRPSGESHAVLAVGPWTAVKSAAAAIPSGT